MIRHFNSPANRTILTLIVAALAAAALVTVPAAMGSRSQSGDTPIFYVIPPKTVQALSQPFRVGEPVTSKNISFCWPRPKPGHFCGGALNKGTVLPAGGTPGDSYDFFEKGFLPFGLVINFKNGNLQGTVKKQLNRVWKFQVCAYQAYGGGKSHAKCAPTSITVVGAYDGDWEGTLTGTYTFPADPPFTGATSSPVNDDISLTVVNGKYSQDGTDNGPSTTIGPNGNGTFTNVFSDDLNCTFQIQFYPDGTASSGQTLSCQATISFDNGISGVETFTGGAIHLKRRTS